MHHNASLDSLVYHKDVAMQLKDTDYYTTTSRLLSDSNSFKINRLINWLVNSGHVNHYQADFLLAVCDTNKARTFHILPKGPLAWPQSNKPLVRIIIVNVDSSRISQYIDEFIRLVSCLHPAYIKNSFNFINYCIRNTCY